jgi:protein phosphatase
LEKIAIISDIHGNVPALLAVLDDIKVRNITRILCLGDLIGKGPSSDIVVDLIREACEIVLMGNWDQDISGVSDHPTDMWHKKKIGEDRVEYLRKLPLLFEFYMSGKFIRLFHASPRSVNERIQPGDSHEMRLSLFESSDHCEHARLADVIGYGDIHNAYVQHFAGKTLFNVGSVGNPLDSVHASYVILEGEYHSITPSPFSIQFVRIPYDIELAVQQAIDANMPNLDRNIIELKTGVYQN